MNEFELIRRYFSRPAPSAVLGVGDDCALVSVRPGSELAISADMLVEGTHFMAGADAFKLGHKALAVNLSDLAAMGAEPRWVTLSLALPVADPQWLDRFSAGFFALAQRYGVELIGGDTTRGPLNLSLAILGEVPAGEALRRSGARAGDDVWISGRLGDAALALAHVLGQTVLTPRQLERCARALDTPEPRVALGRRLRGIATAAIDISDGLVADLGHVLEASAVGASIDLAALPCSPALSQRLGSAQRELALRCVLAGGDDYELCFAAPAASRTQLARLARELELDLSRVGSFESRAGLRIRGEGGEALVFPERGFDHFAS